MQRLTSWFDRALPRRASSRNSRRGKKASRSAAPSVRTEYVGESRCPTTRPPLPPSFRDDLSSPEVVYAEPWECRGRALLRGDSSLSSTRQMPRTNPWVSRTSLRASSHHPRMRLPMTCSSTSSGPSLSPSSSASSPYGVFRLHMKGLEDSLCSSGYGSQDSSPESSVHSPSWTQAKADKAVECRSVDLDEAAGYLEETSSFAYDDCRDDDENIYAELESIARVAVDEEWRVPSSLSSASIHLPHSQCQYGTSSTIDNYPIYARPFEGPSSHSSSTGPWPRPRLLPLLPVVQPGERFRGPVFHAPPPPPEDDDGRNNNKVWETVEEQKERRLRRIEEDFLREIDDQIQELRLKSEAVRTLVVDARSRRLDWRRERFERRFFPTGREINAHFELHPHCHFDL